MKTKTVSILESSPNVLGGAPVFKGTRVPVRNLIDYLEAGDSLDEFLDDFPTVRQHVVVHVEAGRHHRARRASSLSSSGDGPSSNRSRSTSS